MMGPMGPRLGVLAGELWLVAGEETGEDSLLIEDPLKKPREGLRRETFYKLNSSTSPIKPH